MDAPAFAWPAGGNTRVPYRVYTDAENHEREKAKIFAGPTWGFLCAATEIPEAGDYKTTFLGEVPVVVVRRKDSGINALVNRCSHRGSLVALKQQGNTGTSLTCVYHSWAFDLDGNLQGVPFRRGIEGKGGMPDSFDLKQHGLKRLRVAETCGLVFGTLSADAPPLEEHIGTLIGGRMQRVLGNRKLKVLGTTSQYLHNNWKLYVENTKDTYHASLLHSFFSTFKILRLTATGGIHVSEHGGNHASHSRNKQDTDGGEYVGLRSAIDGFGLQDASIFAARDEFGDGITVQILSVFPNFILQQVHNSIALRQVLPKGVDETELLWTFLGFEDDDEEMQRMRLKQANLVGPAGYISMEDGCVGGWVQRAIQGSEADDSVVEMGGAGHASSDSRVSEASVRGFWNQYRGLMGFAP
jgi:phenylpropionate dioxygenase-like ring-hydroxylating dioxygenase large terminal subunit